MGLVCTTEGFYSRKPQILGKLPQLTQTSRFSKVCAVLDTLGQQNRSDVIEDMVLSSFSNRSRNLTKPDANLVFHVFSNFQTEFV